MYHCFNNKIDGKITDEAFTDEEIEEILQTEEEARQGKTIKDNEIDWNEIGIDE